MRDRDIYLIFLVLLFVLIIVCIVVFIIVLLNRGNDNTTINTTGGAAAQQLSPEIWSSSTMLGSCEGYQFEPINSLTLGIPTFDYNIVSQMDGVQGGYPCVWPDQMNEQLYSRTCLSSVCTGMTGANYTTGQVEQYYSYCGNPLVRCSGEVGVIVVGYTVSVSESVLCITSNQYNITVAECNLFDDNQIFVSTNYQTSIYLTRLYQRNSGLCLTYNGSQLLLNSCSSMFLSGYQWLLIPSMTFAINGLFVTSPYQIGYVGNLPDHLSDNVANIKNNKQLRSFIIMNDIQVLYLQGNTLTMRSWYYHPNRTNNQEQNSVFVETKDLSLISNLLLLTSSE